MKRVRPAFFGSSGTTGPTSRANLEHSQVFDFAAVGQPGQPSGARRRAHVQASERAYTHTRTPVCVHTRAIRVIGWPVGPSIDSIEFFDGQPSSNLDSGPTFDQGSALADLNFASRKNFGRRFAASEFHGSSLTKPDAKAKRLGVRPAATFAVSLHKAVNGIAAMACDWLVSFERLPCLACAGLL